MQIDKYVVLNVWFFGHSVVCLFDQLSFYKTRRNVVSLRQYVRLNPLKFLNFPKPFKIMKLFGGINAED